MYIGVLYSIGVSNFDIKSLKILLDSARIAPMVVQNKFDIYHLGKHGAVSVVQLGVFDSIPQLYCTVLYCKYSCVIVCVGKQLDDEGEDILAFTRSIGALMVAYSPLSAYPFVMKPLHDPIVNHISRQRSLLGKRCYCVGGLFGDFVCVCVCAYSWRCGGPESQ